MDEHAPADHPTKTRIKPGQYVIISLRRMIAEGRLKPGERIGEVATAEALGVSRMPVRTALRTLETEGLVVRLGARGYAARAITASEIHGAIEVRGVLEGLAAHRLARRGLTASEEREFRTCLSQGEAIFADGAFGNGALDLFYTYNLAFHALLVDASGNPSIGAALTRNNQLPFASAAALALDWSDRPSEYEHLLSAHRDHCNVVDAIARRDDDAAERLMREHAWAAVRGEKVFERISASRPAG
ncbi:GntR family transcriptional regulator [Novosphingobium sp. Leaf2]|uniref:GntR family transcriptional regulator n=1 Tax=Novosphingobium sp. Leaf2 TaxID=1735670 RepID=UPI0006FB8BA3|nr:GntR family transcriptional regulator [Novosphingobium sp. Leaf2]KQM18363.1 GntR family transcriptional regulator [Novosphingobium sp. Leaf2]